MFFILVILGSDEVQNNREVEFHNTSDVIADDNANADNTIKTEDPPEKKNEVDGTIEQSEPLLHMLKKILK